MSDAIKFVSRDRLNRHLTSRPPGYLDELRPAITGETPDGIHVDTTSPAYKALWEKYRPAIVVPDPIAVAEAQRRFEMCRACEHSSDGGFACDLYHGCCFGRFRAAISNHCLARYW